MEVSSWVLGSYPQISECLSRIGDLRLLQKEWETLTKLHRDYSACPPANAASQLSALSAPCHIAEPQGFELIQSVI